MSEEIIKDLKSKIDELEKFKYAHILRSLKRECLKNIKRIIRNIDDKNMKKLMQFTPLVYSFYQNSEFIYDDAIKSYLETLTIDELTELVTIKSDY